MSLFYQLGERRIVPRWRNFCATATSGELGSFTSNLGQEVLPDQFFETKLAEWKSNPSIGYAADVINSALVLGRESEAYEAAEYVLHPSHHVPQPLRRVARQILGHIIKDTIKSDSRARIRGLRSDLCDDPRNAIAWADMAREYAVLGQLEPSVKAIEKAIILAPTNRFILRSSSRLFLHFGHPERAKAILSTNIRTPHDPWLLAAEIAVSLVMGRSSRFIKTAEELLRRGNHSSFHIAELASALATLELGSGASKQARRLFNTSLNDPTENAVAQAVWAKQHISNIEITPTHLQRPFSFEAKAIQGYNGMEWGNVVENCNEWIKYEPFSKRPAIMGSYLAATLLNDYKMAEMFAIAGLQANPNDPTLKNNLVVSLAFQSRLDEAEKQFNSISKDTLADQEKITLLATQGLLCFRRGQHLEGRELYEKAITSAQSSRNGRLVACALIHLAREEFAARTGAFRSVYERALIASDNCGDLDIGALSQLLQLDVATDHQKPDH